MANDEVESGSALQQGAADVTDVGGAGGPLGGVRDALQQAQEILQQGGPVVMLLLCLSVVAATVALAKLWQFRRARIADLRAAEEALRLHLEGRSDAAVDRAMRSPNPAAQALAAAIHGRMRRVENAVVRAEAERIAADALEALRGHMRVLEVIATLAPLLGLFGTVLGMIAAFQQMEAAGSQVNPAVLSGGIWEALLTTAVGLAVAIPTVAVVNWFERRLDRLAHATDSLLTRVFTADVFSRARPSQQAANSRFARGAPAEGDYAVAE